MASLLEFVGLKAAPQSIVLNAIDIVENPASYPNIFQIMKNNAHKLKDQKIRQILTIPADDVSLGQRVLNSVSSFFSSSLDNKAIIIKSNDVVEFTRLPNGEIIFPQEVELS